MWGQAWGGGGQGLGVPVWLGGEELTRGKRQALCAEGSGPCGCLGCWGVRDAQQSFCNQCSCSAHIVGVLRAKAKAKAEAIAKAKACCSFLGVCLDMPFAHFYVLSGHDLCSLFGCVS